MSGSYPPIEKNDDAYNEVYRFLGEKKCRQIRDLSVVQISQRWLAADVFVSNLRVDRTLKLNPDGTVQTRRQRFRIPRDSFLAKRRRDIVRSGESGT